MLSAVALAGWQTYYVARNELSQLAEQKLPPASAQKVVDYVVAAMQHRAKAEQPVLLTKLIPELETLVLPALRLLEERNQTEKEQHVAAENSSGLDSRPDGADVGTSSPEELHQAGVPASLDGG